MNKADIDELLIKLDDWNSYLGNIHLFPQEADVIIEALELYKEVNNIG